MVFDLIAWLIGLFVSPIVEDDEEVEKEKQQKKKKEEDDWYRRRYERSRQRQFQEEKEGESGTGSMVPKRMMQGRVWNPAFGNRLAVKRLQWRGNPGDVSFSGGGEG